MCNNYVNNSSIKNFILIGADTYSLMSSARQIALKASQTAPEAFYGDTEAFPFEFRYIPPFEKTFNELKRLQGTAALNAGYRSEFRGYIYIDVSNYLKHETENYFDISMKFLADCNDGWRYVFIINDESPRVSLAMAQKILSYIHCSVVYDKSDALSVEKKHLELIMSECSITAVRSTTNLLASAIVNKSLTREAARIMLMDVAQKKGNNQSLSIKDITEYLSSDSPTVKYMLSEEQFNSIVALLKSRKESEKYNDEKI